MELIHPKVEAHLQQLARHGDPLLEEMEARAARDSFPIIGPVAGQFLYQVTRMLGARRVFELGSGYGYSTLWFARGVAANGGGEVYHTVWDEDLSRDAQGYIERAGLSHIVRFRVSEAVQALTGTKGPFDIILNDIDKSMYPDSVPVIKEKLRPGGALIVDNVLWHGRIFDPGDDSPSTRGIQQVTQMLFKDPEFACSILPLRDGLLLALRRDDETEERE